MIRKSPLQRQYLLKLKEEIKDFLVNFEKRYKRFPWHLVWKLKRNEIYSNTIVNVNGTKFPVKDLVDKIKKFQASLKSQLKPSYFNFVLRAYIKDCALAKNDDMIKTTYRNYQKELDRLFHQMKIDLLTAQEMLVALNKSLKKETTVKEQVEMKKLVNYRELYQGNEIPMEESSEEEYDKEKLAIYEACQLGNITIEEREDLLEHLNNMRMLESTLSDEEGDSEKEKYEKTVRDLYEKCAYGEITLEQREALIREAKNIFFSKESEEEIGDVAEESGEEEGPSQTPEQTMAAVRKQVSEKITNDSPNQNATHPGMSAVDQDASAKAMTQLS